MQAKRAKKFIEKLTIASEVSRKILEKFALFLQFRKVKVIIFIVSPEEDR